MRPSGTDDPCAHTWLWSRTAEAPRAFPVVHHPPQHIPGIPYTPPHTRQAPRTACRHQHSSPSGPNCPASDGQIRSRTTHQQQLRSNRRASSGEHGAACRGTYRFAMRGGVKKKRPTLLSRSARRTGPSLVSRLTGSGGNASSASWRAVQAGWLVSVSPSCSFPSVSSEFTDRSRSSRTVAIKPRKFALAFTLGSCLFMLGFAILHGPWNRQSISTNVSFWRDRADGRPEAHHVQRKAPILPRVLWLLGSDAVLRHQRKLLSFDRSTELTPRSAPRSAPSWRPSCRSSHCSPTSPHTSPGELRPSGSAGRWRCGAQAVSSRSKAFRVVSHVACIYSTTHRTHRMCFYMIAHRRGRTMASPAGHITRCSPSSTSAAARPYSVSAHAGSPAGP